MKKNISINISGIIFHIEEDGYENLKKYLDSINKYFASFDDSSEILADIESRIAEIFLSKLNEGKQIITADDVSALMATMGSVNDFRAAEEQESSTKGQKFSQSYSENPNDDSGRSYNQPKQLMRDQKRKTLGGVCAGLGSYLNVDPVWIRLIFAILTFAYGITLIAYVIMWIVVPGSYELEEPEVTKKLFRDTDRKVLGGVAGGVASFLGVDIILVRVLFIICSVVGGLGVLVYIVLWVVLPEARTLTDRIQMQGEPVTLSNIESTIKKNQNLAGNENETQLTKILLFPFRLMAIILGALAKVVGPMVEVLRVAIGIIIILTGLSLVMAVIVFFSVALGVLSGIALPVWLGADFNEMGFPVEIFRNTFPAITTLAAFAVAFIPALYIVLLGISAIAKRIVVGAALGWTMFVLFFAGVAVLAITIPGIAFAFKEEGKYKVETTYQPTGKKLYIKINETGLENYHVTSLTLKGYDGKGLKLDQSFEAQGKTKQNAIENAKMIDYHVDQHDSVITFDSNIQFKKDARFRAQSMHMTLYIPYDYPFVMTEDVSRFISQVIQYDNLDGYTWKMTHKGLTCITCETDNDDENNEDRRYEDLSDFESIDINGVVDVTITQGDNYDVEINASESDKQKYDIHRSGNTLIIDYDNDDDNFWKKGFNMSEMHINITMPRLQQLELKGAGKVNFSGFNVDNMDIEVMGAMNVSGEDVHIQSLNVNISGASSLDLRGSGHNMEATIQGASSLKAYDYEVEDATIEANGASHAKVNVRHSLEMEEGIASSIDYHGSPEIINKRD
jgi:phage shock protein PspC (stress-responsive transcriptional regulator)